MNSTVNSTIQTAATQQQITEQESLHNFCLETFIRNIIFQWLLILLLTYIFKVFLIENVRIKIFDALRHRQVRIKGAFQTLRYAIETIFYIGRNIEFQDSFIRKYGFEVFNFINFLSKLFLAVLGFFTYTLVSSLFYHWITEQSFDYYDFWIGNFDFKRHAFYISVNAFLLSCYMFYILERLQAECREAHIRNLIKGIDDPESKNGVLLRSVFLSTDEPVSDPLHLKTEIAQITDSPRQDPFWLFYFPYVHRLWRWRIKLKKTQELQEFEGQPGTWSEKLFGHPVQDIKAHFKQKLHEYNTKISKDLETPIEFTSQGVILFYRFDDVYRFWKALENEREKFARLAGKRDDYQMIPITPAYRFLRHTKTNFISSYTDIVVGHIHEYKFSYRTVQYLTYLVLAITLMFLTTPAAAIKNYAPIVLASDFSKKAMQEFIWAIAPESSFRGYRAANKKNDYNTANSGLVDSFFHSQYGKYFLMSLFPLVLIISNIMVSFFIEKIGSWQKLPRHSLFHKFVFTLFYFYNMLNLLIIPGVLSGTNSSLFELFMNFDKDEPAYKPWNWKVFNSGIFYSSLIVSSSIVRLASDLMMLVPWVKAGFSYRRMKWKHKHVRRNNGDKQVSDVYTYGYYYSMECVMFSLIYVFGLSQPLMFFTGLTYIMIRCFTCTTVLMLFYKHQVYMGTELYDAAIGKIIWSIPLSFFILAIEFGSKRRWEYSIVNLALSVLVAIAFYFRNGKTFTIEDLMKKVERSRDLSGRLLSQEPLTNEERAKLHDFYVNNTMDKLAADKLKSAGLIALEDYKK